jgi:integrase
MGRARIARRSKLHGRWIWDTLRPYKSNDSVRWVVLYRPGGRGSRESALGTYGTLKLAEARASWANSQIASGKDPRATLSNPLRHETFEEAGIRLRPHRAKTAPKGVVNFDRAMRKAGALKKKPVASLTPQDFVNWVNASPDANSTTRMYLGHYQVLLDLVGLDPNPARHRSINLGSTAPAGRGLPGWVPSYEEFQALLGRLSAPNAAIARLIEESGMRGVEVNGLLRGHIDLGRKTLHVLTTKAGTGGTIPRQIPITTDLETILREEFGIDDLAPTDNVVAKRTACAGMAFTRISHELAFQQTITPHSLRRRYISRLGWAGISIASVARLAGHKHTSTTLDVYSFPLVGEPSQRSATLAREVRAWLPAQGLVPTPPPPPPPPPRTP